MMDRRRNLERRTTLLAAVVILQLLATVFFVADIAGDLRTGPPDAHLLVELGAVLALLAGVLFGAAQIRWLILRARQDEAAVATARGAISDLIRLRFSEWRLTAAEADVALFALKGCDVAEIAALRGAASGTVRAQLARVYAKAGVRSHAALMATLIDELIEAGGAAAAGANPDPGPSENAVQRPKLG